MIELNINDERVTSDASPDTPLLWVLRDHLGMTGTKFGCGGRILRRVQRVARRPRHAELPPARVRVRRS